MIDGFNIPIARHPVASPYRGQSKQSTSTRLANPNLDLTAVLSEQDEYAVELRVSSDDIEKENKSRHNLSRRPRQGDIPVDGDALYVALIEGIIAHRSSCPNLAEFDRRWAFNGSLLSFSQEDYRLLLRPTDIVMNRGALWLSAREYFQANLTHIVRISCRLTVNTEDKSNMPALMMRELVLDKIDRFSDCAQVFVEHSKRHPDLAQQLKRGNSVNFLLWDAAVTALLVANILFFYFAVQITRANNASWFALWSGALFGAIVLDSILLESAENTWYLVLLPGLCAQKMKWLCEELLQNVDFFCQSASLNLIGSEMINFSASDYFFVSTYLARSYPSLESSFVLSMRDPNPVGLTGVPLDVTVPSVWVDEDSRSLYDSFARLLKSRRLLKSCVQMFGGSLPAAVQSLVIAGCWLAVIYGCSSNSRDAFSVLGFALFAALFVFACACLYLLSRPPEKYFWNSSWKWTQPTPRTMDSSSVIPIITITTNNKASQQSDADPFDGLDLTIADHDQSNPNPKPDDLKVESFLPPIVGHGWDRFADDSWARQILGDGISFDLDETKAAEVRVSPLSSGGDNAKPNHPTRYFSEDLYELSSRSNSSYGSEYQVRATIFQPVVRRI